MNIESDCFCGFTYCCWISLLKYQSWYYWFPTAICYWRKLVMFFYALFVCFCTNLYCYSLMDCYMNWMRIYDSLCLYSFLFRLTEYFVNLRIIYFYVTFVFILIIKSHISCEIDNQRLWTEEKKQKKYFFSRKFSN